MAVQAVAERFAEWPKATAKITGELDTLLAFYDFLHLRTTNPIESTFATERQIISINVADGGDPILLHSAVQHEWARDRTPRRRHVTDVRGLVPQRIQRDWCR